MKKILTLLGLLIVAGCCFNPPPTALDPYSSEELLGQELAEQRQWAKKFVEKANKRLEETKKSPAYARRKELEAQLKELKENGVISEMYGVDVITIDDDAPERYRDLVSEYYKKLSEE